MNAEKLSDEESLNMLPYFPLVGFNEKIQRVDVLKYQNFDLQKLLSMQEQPFLHHVLSDKSVKAFIESYLRFGPRPYDLKTAITKPKKLLDEEYHMEVKLFKRVFMIFWRIVESKKSTNQFFDVGKLFDLCAIYAHSNIEFTKKLISKVLLQQPKLFQEIQQSVSMIVSSLEEELINHLQLEKLKHHVAFLYDLTYTVYWFLETVPYCAVAFNDRKLIQNLVICYEYVVPKLFDMKESNLTKMERLEHEQMRLQIDSIKSSIINIADIIIRECYTDVLKLPVQTEEEKLKAAYDAYFSEVGEWDEELKEQVKKLNEVSGWLKDKNVGAEFYDLITSLPSITAKEFKDDKAAKANSGLFLLDLALNTDLQETIETLKEKKTIIGKNEQDSESKLDSLLQLIDQLSQKSKVKKESSPVDKKLTTLHDLFPGHDLKFLQECLTYYKYDIEKVTNAILENTLPSHLQKLNIRPSDQQIKTPKRVDIPVDTSSPVTTDVNPETWDNLQLFTDHEGKQYVKEGDQWVLKKKTSLDVIDDDLKRRIIDAIIYDDEYDDTYDQADAAVIDSGGKDELLMSQKTNHQEQQAPQEEQQEPLQEEEEPKEQQKKPPSSYRGRGGRSRGRWSYKKYDRKKKSQKRMVSMHHAPKQ